MGGTFAKGGMFSKDVMDPKEATWGDLSTGEKTARVGGGVLNGLGKGVQTMQPRPQGGGGAPIQVTPAPPVQTGFDPNYLNAFRKTPVLGSFKDGGTVPKTGNYQLHEGETVVPAGDSIAERNAAEWNRPGGGYDQWKRGDAQREHDLPIGGIAPIEGKKFKEFKPMKPWAKAF